jgi:riboflavin synthase
MFTGLVEDVGFLVSRTEGAADGKLLVRTGLPLAEISVGDSIAVNGACLTVEDKQGSDKLSFHTLAETLRRTNLGRMPTGAELNLERSLRLDARLGGHLVQGHVDAVGEIISLLRGEGDIVVRISLPASIRHLAIGKGSIAINGISLTIAELREDSFAVHVIPHSWQATNLRSAKEGDAVNLEGDMVGKYVLRSIELAGGDRPRLTMEDLHNAGW